MPLAAVPAYLGRDFKDASPGMRFGMLLPIWTNRQDQEADVRSRAEKKSQEGQEVSEMLKREGMDATIRQLCQRERNPLPGLWDRNDYAARNAWKNIAMLSNSDRDRMKALAERQNAIAAGIADLLRLDALAIAPFTTGLGNEHPLENGFAFLNPYGLPYLPASGVKGVLRQAARELASGEWGDSQGWSEEPRYALMEGEGEIRRPVLDKNKRPVMLSMLDALFGRETPSGESDHVRGALSFWDVIPQIAPEDPKKPDQISLAVEIMTPHQSHYYQENRERKAGDSITPHESGQPNPISFLTVPPGSGFTFHVVCDLVHLRRIAPELAENNQWKTLLTAAFEHAFDWLGFGAKTAVGYGAMRRDPDAEAQAAQARAQREKDLRDQREEALRQARLAALSPNQRRIEEFVEKAKQRLEQLRGGRDKPHTHLHSEAMQLTKTALESPDWSAEEKRALAEAIETWLPRLVERFDRKDDWKEARKKLKLAALKGEA